EGASVADGPGDEQLISDVRATGARIRLITDGDVAGAIMAAREGTGVDLLLGIGGTPEGIIAACAVKCLGGVIQGKLTPRDDAERDRALAAGHDLSRVLTTDDLVASDDAFFAATGITNGELLAGVRYRAGGATTHSLVMRARSGTVRNIYSEHQLWNVTAYSAVTCAGGWRPLPPRHGGLAWRGRPGDDRCWRQPLWWRPGGNCHAEHDGLACRPADHRVGPAGRYRSWCALVDA